MENATHDNLMIENTPILHIGPSLDAGPLPSVFYFALTAEESLLSDPYNQPSIMLAESNIRVFSISIPMHHNNKPPKEALNIWADKVDNNENIFFDFIEKTKKIIQILIEKNLINPDYIAVMGLSRGSYLALHLLAQFPRIKWLLGFAPLTDLSVLTEFKEIKNIKMLKDLDLSNYVNALINKKIRFYIGNNDIRVGTKSCFSLIEKISKASFLIQKKQSPSELIISPSIGLYGHGTKKETFFQGANWLKSELLNQS